VRRVEKVEWTDIQGLVPRGYGKLKRSAYVLWRFKPDRSEAETKRWITELAGRLARADASDETREKAKIEAINVALTASGLKALGVKEDELAFFSVEFREGMAPERAAPNVIPRRCNQLGDLGDNSPEHWEWGGWRKRRDIDGVLLLFAREPDPSKPTEPHPLTALIDAERARMRDVAEVILVLEGRSEEDLRAHFGFRDGLSNPLLPGTELYEEATQEERWTSAVKLGEFILGCPNERDDCVSYFHAPTGRDLGRNGTYLVFRQLAQDVTGFRKFVRETAALHFGTADEKTEGWVASRLVGRSIDGEPLISAPATAAPQGDRKRNDFLYHFEDRFGVACPLGSHIRRAGPRDVGGPDPHTALRISRMHRILRRGRSYGEELPKNAPGNDGVERGLHFLCLNASIGGQFEFVQHTWLNNPHFSRLYDEVDVLGHVAGGRAMTIQDRPVNRRIEGLPQFVKVKGGAYFFMPGIKALLALGAGGNRAGQSATDVANRRREAAPAAAV
jgi:Dyp-type peroxidase family